MQYVIDLMLNYAIGIGLILLASVPVVMVVLDVCSLKFKRRHLGMLVVSGVMVFAGSRFLGAKPEEKPPWEDWYEDFADWATELDYAAGRFSTASPRLPRRGSRPAASSSASRANWWGRPSPSPRTSSVELVRDVIVPAARHAMAWFEWGGTEAKRRKDWAEYEKKKAVHGSREQECERGGLRGLEELLPAGDEPPGDGGHRRGDQPPGAGRVIQQQAGMRRPASGRRWAAAATSPPLRRSSSGGGDDRIHPVRLGQLPVQPRL